MALALCTTCKKTATAEKEPKTSAAIVHGNMVYYIDLKFGLCFAKSYFGYESTHQIKCNDKLIAEANRLLGRTTHAKGRP